MRVLGLAPCIFFYVPCGHSRMLYSDWTICKVPENRWMDLCWGKKNQSIWYMKLKFQSNHACSRIKLVLKTWWFEMVIQMLKMKNMHIFYKKKFLSYQYYLESSDICSICQKNLSGLKIISWKVDIWSFRKLFFFANLRPSNRRPMLIWYWPCCHFLFLSILVWCYLQ